MKQDVIGLFKFKVSLFAINHEVIIMGSPFALAHSMREVIDLSDITALIVSSADDTE